MKNLVPLLLLFALPVLAHADSREDLKKIDADLSACLAKSENNSEMGMKMCTSDAYQSADKVLNQLYQAEVANLKRHPDEENREILKRLQASERAWIAYRDANSRLQGSTDLGGSNEGLDISSANLEMTKDRVLELDQLFNND